MTLAWPDSPAAQRSGGTVRDQLDYIAWVAEAADPQVYDDRIIRAPSPGIAPRHVLMLRGMVDHYIMPPIANTTSMSLGLDLGGDALDEKTPEVAGLTTAVAALSFVGRGKVALPASGT